MRGNDAQRFFGPAAATISKHLAYIEWFKLTSPTAKPHHLLYQVKRSLRNDHRLASIIPIENIQRSIHFFPAFEAVVPHDWTSDNVLEKCEKFYINVFSDRHAYHTII